MPRNALRKRSLDADDEELDRRRAALPFWIRLLLRSPRDSLLAILAAAAVAAIFANGLFLQPGPHPAPIFALKPPPISWQETTGAIAVLPRPRPADLPTGRFDPPVRAREDSLKGKVAAQATSSTLRTDPIAAISAPSRQLMAVQRALGDFGYGQIKPTGIYDANTRAGVEMFERARKLPITGQISERLVRELAAVTGRPLN